MNGVNAMGVEIPTMPILVENLRKRFGPFTAIDGIEFEVADGERVCLLGPNGSGKTTLLRMMAGLVRPTSGTIHIDDLTYDEPDATIRDELGFVSHETMLYDDLTARENLRFHANIAGVEPDRVEEVLELVDLSARASGLPREFSHGMKKRLSVARALLHRPSILVLDEPFTGLDQESAETVESLLTDRTVVVSTHELQRGIDICDRILILDDGNLKHDTTSASVDDAVGLRNRYQHATG